jgi:hypothetical protein
MDWNNAPPQPAPGDPTSYPQPHAAVHGATAPAGNGLLAQIRRGVITATLAGALLVGGGVAVVAAASPDPSASPAPTTLVYGTGTDGSGSGATTTTRAHGDCPDKANADSSDDAAATPAP